MKRAEDAETTGFKGLNGWLNGALTRHILRINIHGEVDDLTDE